MGEREKGAPPPPLPVALSPPPILRFPSSSFFFAPPPAGKRGPAPVFGLGDSTYYFYCHTAKLMDARLAELGAQRMLPLGIGDDGDEDAFHTGFSAWAPKLWAELKTKTPEEALFTPP